MALAQLPPDQTETEKKEYAAWLDSAIGQLRSAEMEETYDNLSAILSSKAYVALASSEGGYPSPSAFMSMAPELRKQRLATLLRSPDKMEEGMMAFLDNLAESDPDRALALIGDLSRGGVSADFKAQLAHAADIAHRAQAEASHINPHHDFSSLNALHDPAPHMASPPIVPGMEAGAPAPHEPAERHPKIKRGNSIKDADRIMRKLIGGEEAGG